MKLCHECASKLGVCYNCGQKKVEGEIHESGEDYECYNSGIVGSLCDICPDKNPEAQENLTLRLLLADVYRQLEDMSIKLFHMKRRVDDTVTRARKMRIKMENKP